MNKKLVAVAIAGLLAAPLASAQTANVTLYGRLNLSIEGVKGKQTNNTNPTVFRVTSKTKVTEYVQIVTSTKHTHFPDLNTQRGSCPC